MALELVCGADFWCNQHCRTSPVVLEGFWGQVWPKIGQKPEKSEYRFANEPLRLSKPYPEPYLGKAIENPPCPSRGRLKNNPRDAPIQPAGENEAAISAVTLGDLRFKTY